MNDWTSPVDIRPDHLEMVQDILREHLPAGFKVWVFGSRANWTTKDSSDLDLAVEGTGRLDYKAMVGLEVAFEESDLPYTVDVVDLNDVSSSFKQIMEDQRVALPVEQNGANVGAWRETVYGKFPNHFRADTLVNLCIRGHGIQTGPFGSQLHQRDYVSKGTPIITVEHLGQNRITTQDLPRVSDYDRIRLSKYTLQEGDVVFSRVGSVDRRALVREEQEGWLFSGRCLRVRPDPSKIDAGYISYFFGLDSFQEYIRAIAVGATMPSLNTQILSDVPILYPPLPEQRAIAHILGALDDKIELNRRMNETLEAMARALFKSWFVDFEPVRAKMEGHWRRGQSLPGLPAEHYDLFPDCLVDSELGEIPEGWGVKPLSDCIDLVRGLSYKGSGLASTGIPMHNLNSIYEGGGYKEDGIKYYNGNFQDRHVTQPGDVLVANTEQGHDRLLIGFAAIVPRHLGGEGLFSHHLYRIQPNRSSALSADYVYRLLNTRSMHGIVSGYATGTTVNMLPVDALRIPSIAVPPNRLVTTFSRVDEAVRERQYSLLTECQNLAAQRDGLLPRLVSGELAMGTE